LEKFRVNTPSLFRTNPIIATSARTITRERRLPVVTNTTTLNKASPTPDTIKTVELSINFLGDNKSEVAYSPTLEIV
jgi:hypothetical protein